MSPLLRFLLLMSLILSVNATTALSGLTRVHRPVYSPNRNNPLRKWHASLEKPAVKGGPHGVVVNMNEPLHFMVQDLIELGGVPGFVSGATTVSLSRHGKVLGAPKIRLKKSARESVEYIISEIVWRPSKNSPTGVWEIYGSQKAKRYLLRRLPSKSKQAHLLSDIYKHYTRRMPWERDPKSL